MQEYERFKQAAEDIDAMPRLERDIHTGSAEPPPLERRAAHPDVSIAELLLALQGVLQRADHFSEHHVEREALSVRERMSSVLAELRADRFVEFTSLFDPAEGRLGVVVTFLAALELVKESLADLVQAEPFAAIYLKARGESAEPQTE